jgi:hypothetical protein
LRRGERIIHPRRACLDVRADLERIETMPRRLPRILVILTSLALAGCGAATTRVAGTTSPPVGGTPIGEITPTLSPSPIATQSTPCGSTPTYASAKRAGDLLITDPLPGGSTYPSTKLPDGTSLKPLQVQWASSTSGVALSRDLLTNPNLHEIVGGFGGGYNLSVCNASTTQTHTIQYVTARIDSFAAYSGALSEWGFCAGGPFDAATKQSKGAGCGGAFYTACEYLHATFAPSASAGAIVMASQVGDGRDVTGDAADCPQFGALPVALPAGAELTVLIGMTAPAASGVYAVAFGVAADSAAPVFISAPPMLFAPAAHEWSGGACATPTMQAQIPSASVPTFYLCPQA